MKKAVIFLCFCAAIVAGYYGFNTSPPIKNADPGGSNIICFGDSLTFGTGAGKGEDYPSHLSRLIGKPVINAGVPGNTTADALVRLDRDVLSKDPRVVLITIGGNDLKNRVDKKSAFENLKQIVETIQDRGALVILGGVRFPLYDRGFSQAYKTLAKETGIVLIPNVFDGIMGNADLMSDPIHPNGKGYALMAEKFHDAVKPYL